MKTVFRIPVQCTFKGGFVVEAESVYQAAEMVRDSCGMNCGEIYSDLPEDEVNWDFDMIPELVIFPDGENE